uniref:Uncharacterized protein n=2 Tax=Oreochromis TaxID=8139 RepID=A0A669ENT1_ORENI
RWSGVVLLTVTGVCSLSLGSLCFHLLFYGVCHIRNRSSSIDPTPLMAESGVSVMLSIILETLTFIFSSVYVLTLYSCPV